MRSSLLSLFCALSLHSALCQVQLPLPDTTKHLLLAVQYQDTTKKISIDRVFVIGNKRTRDHIILRELTLKTGDSISATRLATILDLDKKKLINTRLFNTVEIKTLPTTEEKIDLLVDLTERWYTFPAPIFEFADRNFNEWWQNYNHDFSRVNYGLRLYQYNMRGRNETLRLTAQFGFIRKFDLAYRIPYIDGKQKQGLVFDFDYSETRNLAIQTTDHKLIFRSSEDVLKTTQGVGVAYTYRNSFYQTHSLRAEYRNTKIADSVGIWNPNYFKGESLSQRYMSLTYSFTSDHRDYFAYPLKGHYFNFYVQKTGIAASDDVNKIETGISYAKFFPFRKNYFLSTNLVAVWSAPDDVAYNNYTALGFRKQFVRGYEVYVIEGPYYFLAKATFKKLLFSRQYNWNLMPIHQFQHVPIQIYLKSYADAGFVQNYPFYQNFRDQNTVAPLNSSLSNRIISGIGTGLDVVSFYDVVFRFEYTLNAEGSHGFFFHVKREF